MNNNGNCNYDVVLAAVRAPGALSTNVKEAQLASAGGSVVNYAKCDGRVGGVNDATTTNSINDQPDCDATTRPVSRSTAS